MKDFANFIANIGDGRSRLPFFLFVESNEDWLCEL